MLEIEHSQSGKWITLRASGTLNRADFDRALPEIENAMALANNPLKLMVRLEDFQGLEMAALWEELKFGLEHNHEFGAIAVVGDTKVEEWGTWLASLFANSEVKYFSFDAEGEARNWLKVG
jgi:hypothetical protein